MTANRLLNDEIVIRGAREHNLRDVTVRMPRDRSSCITGLSGSGKSSLAFDTLYAEGQRRYVESLSAYARQFLGQMEKPDVDSIEGLSPAISIEQKTTSRNPRSTVGTVTEIYDYLRLLFARIGQPHCPICGRPIAGQSAEQIVDQVLALPAGHALHGRRAARARPQGRAPRRARRACAARASRACASTARSYLLDEVPALDKKSSTTSRSSSTGSCIKDDLRQRLTDSVETALRIGDGLRRGRRGRRRRCTPYSEKFACPEHGVSLPELDAAHVLVQLAARRLPGLHRPRRDARDRSRAGRARPDAVDPRGRARAVERRPARASSSRCSTAIADQLRRSIARHAVGRAPARARRTCSCTAPAASACT